MFFLKSESGVLNWQKLESQVGELQATRDQVQQEVEKLQKEGSEVKRKAKELQRSLEKEKAGWDKASQCCSVLVLMNIWLILSSDFLFVPLYFNNVLLKHIVPLLRATTLQEELKKKAAALSDIQQQMEHSEQDKAALKMNLDKVTQEGNTRHAELDRKAQSLAADLQKAQQEKEAQRKELVSTQESLGKANKALKESQSQLDTERKSHKSAMEEKVGSAQTNSIFFLLFYDLQHQDIHNINLSQSSG